MEERKLDNLILTNETKVLIGDFTIKGEVIIKNSELIVFGDLTFCSDVTLENSEVIVSGSLWITSSCAKISNIASDISVGVIDIFSTFVDSLTVFSIQGGDIFVAGNFNSDIEISSNSDITVCGDFSCNKNVSCLNLSVCGFINCNNINAILDIYCLDGIDSFSLSGRDLFSNGCINCNGYPLEFFGSIYAADGIYDCSSISVGK